MKRLFILFFLCASSVFAQGVIVNPKTVLGTTSGLTRPIPSATITVCAAGASGTPCAPPLSGTLFKDAALTQPLSNPFTSDANGNYQFAVAGGTYTITETAIGFIGYSYQLTVSCAPGICNITSLTVTGAAVFNGGITTTTTNSTGAGTHSGSETFSGMTNILQGSAFFSSGSPWIDVKSSLYGAACNGVTDDAASINSASTAASSASVGASAVVYLPQGNCDVKSQIVNKQGSIFRGEDKGSSILADATFPASTPLVQVGNVALNDVTRVEHIVVDCNNVTGCNGLSTTTAQEMSGADYVTVRRAMGFGVDVESNSQNSIWSNMQVGSGGAAPGTFEGFHINTNAAVKTTIFNATITPSVGSITSCIRDVLGMLFAVSIHCEDATDGIRFDSGAFGMVHGFTGASSNTNAVKINAGAGAVSLTEIEKNGGTNTVNDTDCSVTLSTDNVIPWYVHSHSGAKCAWLDSLGFHTSAFVSSGAVPTASGTGACATITTQTGGQFAGTFKCTGGTAASTVTLTFATTMPTGWRCSMDDETTWSAANAWHETSHTATTCAMTSASITANDVTIFSAVAF